MFKKFGYAALASVLGASVLFMPSEASAATIPAAQRDAAANIGQQGDLLQNVQYERRRWYRYRDGRYRGDRARTNRFRGDRLRGNYERGFRYRDGRSRGARNWPRYRYRGGNYAGFGYQRGYYRDRSYGRRYYNRWDRGPGWAVGLPFAIAGAAVLGSNYYGGYGGGYGGSDHVRWCSSRYRSYNPRSNTWVGYSGRVYQCSSPYDGR